MAADIFIKPRIAVCTDIKAGGFLIAQIGRNRIGILLTKTRIDHRRAK